MKRTPAEDLAKFNESVSILVKAYLNDTLQHRVCTACAVGNLIAASMGTLPKRRESPVQIIHRIAETDKEVLVKLEFENNEFENGVHEDWYMGTILGTIVKSTEQTERTGYSSHELAKIEEAFESASFGNAEDEWNYNGLMKVVSELASIHSIDLETTEAARKLFVKV